MRTPFRLFHKIVIICVCFSNLLGVQGAVLSEEEQTVRFELLLLWDHYSKLDNALSLSLNRCCRPEALGSFARPREEPGVIKDLERIGSEGLKPDDFDSWDMDEAKAERFREIHEEITEILLGFFNNLEQVHPVLESKIPWNKGDLVQEAVHFYNHAVNPQLGHERLCAKVFHEWIQLVGVCQLGLRPTDPYEYPVKKIFNFALIEISDLALDVFRKSVCFYIVALEYSGSFYSEETRRPFMPGNEEAWIRFLDEMRMSFQHQIALPWGREERRRSPLSSCASGSGSSRRKGSDPESKRPSPRQIRICLDGDLLRAELDSVLAQLSPATSSEGSSRQASPKERERSGSFQLLHEELIDDERERLTGTINNAHSINGGGQVEAPEPRGLTAKWRAFCDRVKQFFRLR